MLEGLFQPMHLIIILAIAVIIFGPGKLPELGAGLGKSVREFKKALSEEGSARIETTGENEADGTKKEV